MNLILKLISNFKAKKYNSSKLREMYSIRNDEYLKSAFKNASNYIKIQAVDYLGDLGSQENLDFLLREFKIINNLKLKSYTYQSIIWMARDEKLNISKADESILVNNINLLDNIGIVTQVKKEINTHTAITFRDKIKDHLIDLEKHKKINADMIR